MIVNLVNLDTGEVLREGKAGIESVTSSIELNRAMENNPNVIVLSGQVGYTGSLNDWVQFYLGARGDIEIPTNGENTELDASLRGALRVLPIQAFDPLNPNSDRFEVVLGAQQDLTTAPLGYENMYDPASGEGSQSMTSFDGTMRYHFGRPGQSVFAEVSARKIDGHDGLPFGAAVGFPISDTVRGYLQHNNQTLFPDRTGGINPTDAISGGVNFSF